MLPDHPRRRLLFVAALAVFGFPPRAQADRILGIIISVDGKPHLYGDDGDDGRQPPLTVWRYLASAELRPAPDVVIAPDPSNPLTAILRGRVDIRVDYGGKAVVRKLRLVRPDVGRTRWSVAPADVERIARDIGLVPGEGRPRSIVWPSIGILAGAAVLAGWLILARRKRGGIADPG